MIMKRNNLFIYIVLVSSRKKLACSCPLLIPTGPYFFTPGAFVYTGVIYLMPLIYLNNGHAFLDVLFMPLHVCILFSYSYSLLVYVDITLFVIDLC